MPDFMEKAPTQKDAWGTISTIAEATAVTAGAGTVQWVIAGGTIIGLAAVTPATAVAAGVGLLGYMGLKLADYALDTYNTMMAKRAREAAIRG